MTRGQAFEALTSARIGPMEASEMLTDAARFPGTWQYDNPSRTRCVVKHMPGGDWKVRDCAASEAAIRRARASGRQPARA